MWLCYFYISLRHWHLSHMHIPLATYTSRRYINLSQEWQSEPIGLCSQILTDSRGTTWDHSEILISLSRSYRSVDTSEPGNYKTRTFYDNANTRPYPTRPTMKYSRAVNTSKTIFPAIHSRNCQSNAAKVCLSYSGRAKRPYSGRARIAQQDYKECI